MKVVVYTTLTALLFVTMSMVAFSSAPKEESPGLPVPPQYWRVPSVVDVDGGTCALQTCQVAILCPSDLELTESGAEVLAADGYMGPFGPSFDYLDISCDGDKYTGYRGEGAAETWASIHRAATNPLSASLLSGFHALVNSGVALSMIDEGMPEGWLMLYYTLLKHPERMEALFALREFSRGAEEERECSADHDCVLSDLSTAMEALNDVGCLHCRLHAALELDGIAAVLKDPTVLSRSEIVARSYFTQRIVDVASAVRSARDAWAVLLRAANLLVGGLASVLAGVSLRRVAKD